MCMNIDATLAVTKRWEEEELLHSKNYNHSKLIRQRQLGLLRGTHSADVLTRRIKTADELSSHASLRDRFSTNGRENRYPVDKNGPSLLSREKFRMLRQIRAENAETVSKAADKQTKCQPPRSGPASSNFIHNDKFATGREPCGGQHHHSKEPKNCQLQETLQIVAGDSEPSQRNIFHELRERSKYLPALLKEFKKLEVKCPDDDVQTCSLRPYSRNSVGAKNSIPDITCATILAAIRTTKENQGTKRALSAPIPSTPSQGTISSRKPQYGIARSQKSFKYSPTTSGVILAPGVNAVYSPLPPPPQKKIHNQVTTSYPSASTTSSVNHGRKVTSQGFKRGRSSAGRIWSAGTIPHSLTMGERSKNEHMLTCKNMRLNRSKSASQLEQIQESLRHSGRDGVESSRMRLPSKPRFERKKKSTRMVRFSEEEDKVYEFTRDELMTSPQKLSDSVFVYTTTANLRKCLDQKLDHQLDTKL